MSGVDKYLNFINSYFGVVSESTEHDEENVDDHQSLKTHQKDGGIKGRISTSHEDSHILRNLKDSHQARIHVDHLHPSTGKYVRSKVHVSRHGDDIHMHHPHEDDVHAVIKHSSIKPGPKEPSRSDRYKSYSSKGGGTMQPHPEHLHNTWHRNGDPDEPKPHD